MRFAFITDELPRPGSAGHLAMNHAIIAWLRGNGHDVTILLPRPRLRKILQRFETARVASPALASWGDLLILINLPAILGILARRIVRRLPMRLRALLRRIVLLRRYGKVDEVLGAFMTQAESAWCVGRLQARPPDALFVDTIFRMPLLREPALERVPCVVIAHDLFHRRHRAMTSAGYRLHPPELNEAAEAELLNMADAIVAIQPEEAAAILTLCPERMVCVAPMPALPCARPENVVRIRGRLIFIGSATMPNLDGLRWLFAEIWPRLRQLFPPATLDLAGDCGDGFASLPEGVARLGRVAELAPVLHRAALAVAPLRVGTGLKIKILDYARHGLLTVATPESLQGFAPDPLAPFILAEDAASFATAAAARLAQAAPEDEQRAYHYVARHYHPDASFSGLAAALNLPERRLNPFAIPASAPFRAQPPDGRPAAPPSASPKEKRRR